MKHLFILLFSLSFLFSDTVTIGINSNGSGWHNDAISNTKIVGNFKICSIGTIYGAEMFGFSNFNASDHFNTIDYAFYINKGNTYVYESGTRILSLDTKVTSNNTVCVVRINDTITYTIDDDIKYTSLIKNLDNGIFDMSIYGSNDYPYGNITNLSLNGKSLKLVSANGVVITETLTNNDDLENLATDLNVSIELLYVLFGFSGSFLAQFFLFRIS